MCDDRAVSGSDARGETGATGTPDPDPRFAALAVALSALVFGGLLLFVPPFFVSFDEAKYIGIGYNLLDGLGPRTPFGDLFLSHAPVWAATLVLPNSWFGIDPLDVGHVLDGIAGVALVAAAGVLGWRIRPLTSGLAAAATIAITYLHDLTRTARLDTPAAFLAVAYLLVASWAIRRGSPWRAIVAGLLFALAFEVKEIALPLFPVPFLAAVVSGRPWRVVGEAAGWTVLAASAGLSWWFLLVARLTGSVYRLGTPAWTLLPIAAVVLTLAIASVVLARGGERAWLAELGRRLRLEAGGPGRGVVLLLTVVAWCAALTLVFAGTLEIRGTDVIDPRQINQYVATWLPGLLKVAAAIGAVGVALSVGAWRAANREGRTRSVIVELWLAAICSAPLVLLVIEVGEPPRNYLAQLAILAALSATGWLWLIETVVARVPAMRARWPALASLILVGSVVGSGGVLAQHALTFRETRTGQARAAAVRTAVEWVRGHVPAGERVAIGSFLSYEISIGLRGDHPTAQVRHIVAIGDPAAPLGIRVAGAPPEDDWLAADIAPRNANEFQAFFLARLSRDIRADGVRYWIYATEAETSAPEIVEALPEMGGVHELASWQFPTSAPIPIGLHVYEVAADQLTVVGGAFVVSPAALARLVALLEAEPAVGKATAARLVDRIVVRPAGPATDALLTRLRVVAGS
jgi:hypothetical protein